MCGLDFFSLFFFFCVCCFFVLFLVFCLFFFCLVPSRKSGQCLGFTVVAGACRFRLLGFMRSGFMWFLCVLFEAVGDRSRLVVYKAHAALSLIRLGVRGRA